MKDGQVVHIKVKDNEPLLSLQRLSLRQGRDMEFIYAVKGAGQDHGGLQPGDEIDLLGPTGKAYELKGAKKIAILGREWA